jgi:cytochrome c2
MRKAGVAGLVWDQATLDKFLENPMRFLQGTRGLRRHQERPRAPKSAQI